MDIISRLPQPIQHDILNFLEEDEIARAAVLSKAWRSIVQTRPVLVLDQRIFRRKLGSNLLFMNHVDKSVQKLVGQDDQSIQKFSLVTDVHDTKSWSHYLDRWIQQMVQAKLKVLSLHLNLKQVYVLPPFVFLSETITNLRLVRCELGQCDYMRLPNLLELTLRYVTLSQDMIHQISSGCPNLEILQLLWCRGFSSICVSGLARLHEVELSLSGELDVKVLAPMLRVFKIHSWHYSAKIDLLGCESTLRNLTLSSVPNMTTECLRSLVSKFPGLEELLLRSLYVEIIDILNQKLLQLQVDHCSRLKRHVRIDAPNLLVLKYSDNNLPFDPVNSNFSPNCITEFQVRFYLVNLESYKDTFEDLFVKLKEFTNMKLIVPSYVKQEVFVCEFLDVNVLKMIYDSQTTGPIAEVDRVTTDELLLYRLFGSGDHWKNISIVSRDQQSSRKFLEVLSKEKLKDKEEEPNCCRYKFSKCWRHSLYDAEMIDEETSMTPDLSKSFVAMGYKTARIKLQWS